MKEEVAVLALTATALSATMAYVFTQDYTTTQVKGVSPAGFINAKRVSLGLHPLVNDARLATDAYAWSKRMASVNGLKHSNYPYTLTSIYQEVGENVGVAGSLDEVNAALWRSPEHHANMVDPTYTNIGVGVFAKGDFVWVTELFAETVPHKTVTPQRVTVVHHPKAPAVKPLVTPTTICR